MSNEERMAQIIAEKDHTIGVLASVVEDYRARFEETEAELKHSKTLERVWWEHYRDLMDSLGGDEDE